MAAITSTILRVPLVGRRKIAILAARAKKRGLTPEKYASELIDDALAIQREAEQLSFAEIMAPVRKAWGRVDEAEIVDLVETARRDYYGTSTRGKKR